MNGSSYPAGLNPGCNPTPPMKPTQLRFAALVCCFLGGTLPAQQPVAPDPIQTIVYVKVARGKDVEFIQLVTDTFRKMAQTQADAGELVSWTLLRAVMPAGDEARADFAVSAIHHGPPPEPMGGPAFEAAMKKAGITLTLPEFRERLATLSTLLNVEMCRIRARAGAPQKGHYLLVNQMKVHDAAAQIDYARTIRQPLAAELVRQGELSGWLLATRILTVGSETPNMAFSVDMYPTWQALFGPRSARKAFETVHPGKDYEAEMARINKYREVTRRDLWVVVDRVEKST